MYKRSRGTALVDTEKGILVVSGKHKIFMLPGGGADRGESRQRAAIRELKEETGLNIVEIKFIFKYVGEPHKSHQGGMFQDYHKVFLIKTVGIPKPHHEVKYVEYYNKYSNIKITKQTKEIIDKYKAEYVPKSSPIQTPDKHPNSEVLKPKKPWWKFW